MISAEIVEKALEQIRKRPANHDYFFSKLNTADWIEPLDQAGLFSDPPNAIREGNAISFPFWPESQYLARVASDSPEQVAAILMKIPETDNVRVHEDLARAAIKLPGKLAAQWVRQEISWIKRQEHLYFLFPESLGELIAHLASSGEPQVSLTLAEAVLAVSSVGDSPRQVSARFDNWHYARILQEFFPDVLRHTAVKGLHLLCDLLSDAVGMKPEGDEDYSWIWRPAIEPHEQNQGYDDLPDALIDAIRDGSSQLILNSISMEDILRVLLGRPKIIFKRLALHLLAENYSHSAAKELASDRENFYDERLLHEYNQLLKAVFTSLDEDSRSKILSWIEDGPSEVGGDGEDPDLLRRQKAYWQAKRLFCIRGQLPAKWEKRYAKIVAELGEPKHPDFYSYTTTWTGPTSPKEADELQAMPVRDVATYLNDWRPAEGWNTPTPEGLGRVLESVVANSPDRFVEELGSFHGAEPTYARAILQGLNGAVRAGQAINWPPVISYLMWIANQPREIGIQVSGRLDRDPHWGWARKSAMNLLSSGFEKDSIDLMLRGQVWQIIEKVAEDPDPTVEDDEKDRMDPATQSINTTRGEALHAVIRYALWIQRMITAEDADTPRTFNMSVIPEVQDCLEQHLDPIVEPSPAIRAVFGQWFPWLLLLDSEWAKSKVDSIFPDDNPRLRDAAWYTYLRFSRVYDDAFQVLRLQYSASVKRLSIDKENDKSEWYDRVGERLGEHLMLMVGRGVLNWSDEDDLVRGFFNNAMVSDASHAVEFVGRSISNESNKIAVEVIERFRMFWEELAAYVKTTPGDRIQLLVPFGGWFASGRFDIQWSFEWVGRVIETTGWIEPDFLVMKRLGKLSARYPAQCLAVLKALVSSDQPSWKLIGWNDSVQTVLKAALESEEVKEDAKMLIHKLGARGHMKFRELIRATAL